MAQQTPTFSKSTRETPENGVKYIEMKSAVIVNFENISHFFSTVSHIHFEQ